MTTLLIYQLSATLIVYTQLLVKWGLWYIYRGFLVWITLLTYWSHVSGKWVYTTDLHAFIFYIWYMWLMIHTCFYFIFAVYCLLACLEYTIHWYSCTRVLSWARYLAFMYSLGCILTTLDLHVKILKFGPWWRSLLLIGVRSGSVASPRVRIWQKLGNVSDGPPDPSSLSDSLDSFFLL